MQTVFLSSTTLLRRRLFSARLIERSAHAGHTGWLFLCALLFSGIASAAPVITVFAAAGDLGTVTGERDAFRIAVGGGNVAGAAGSFGGVRREINWDGVPDAFADPSPMPANFFNVNSPRGVVFNTPGTGFMVSANAGQAAPVQFGFGNELEAFSAQRLFTAVNSNITDVNFFLPGTGIPATTSAFGVIFSDVDLAGGTRMEFFDLANQLLFSSLVPASGGDELFSFFGITVDSSLISRVRITAGSTTLLANGVLGGAGDLVAMDDFIYAEPTVAAVVSEPPGFALVAVAVLLAGLGRRRRCTRA